MDEGDVKRLRMLCSGIRRAKCKLVAIQADIQRWNAGQDSDMKLKPITKILEQAVDHLLDLNNACAERERAYYREDARQKVGR